jgi:hypothetical protein
MTADVTTRASTTQIDGRWRSRLGSTMELRRVAGDVLTGTYRIAIGTRHPEQEFSLSGFVLGDAITFSVDFRPHGSVAAWTGHHVMDSGEDRLSMLWHLAEPVSERGSGGRDDGVLWRGVLAGADEFERIG